MCTQLHRFADNFDVPYPFVFQYQVTSHQDEMSASVIIIPSKPLPIRLVVGHQTLDLGARVRILHRQPTNPEDAASRHVLAPLRWPVRLVAQDTALSRLKQGFDSPTGYHLTGASIDPNG